MASLNPLKSLRPLTQEAAKNSPAPKRPAATRWFRTTRYAAAVVAGILILVLVAVSFRSLTYVALGVAAALVLSLIVSAVRKGGWRVLVILVVTTVLLMVAAAALALFTFGLPLGPMAMGYPPCNNGERKIIEPVNYHLVVTPQEFADGTFRVSENITYNLRNLTCSPYSPPTTTLLEENVALALPEREITSISRGFLLREVHVVPLQNSPLAGVSPSAGTIELRDLPRGAFYEAYDAPKPEFAPFLDTEIIRWQSGHLGREIVFAYMAPPFHLAKNLLAPLAGLASQSEWWFVLLGTIAAWSLESVLKPVLADKLKSLFKRPALAQAKTAT